MNFEIETACRNSLSQRQRDTENLMLHLTWLADAKAAGNVRLVWEALDDIAAAAMDCDTHAVQLRYIAALTAHRAEYRSAGCTDHYRSLDVFWQLPTAAEAMDCAVRSWLRGAALGNRP